MSSKSPHSLRHIAIAGNIGAGKTTLCQKLANHYHWNVHFEDEQHNPYLPDFYDDMKRWSFHLQIHFLHNRYKQIVDIQSGSHTVVQDRTIYEDAYIFAPNLRDMGLMSKRDFENYHALFQTMTQQISAPDLLIYLKADISTLVSHIQTRGRDYEGNMSLDYLRKLNERYEKWISDYKEGPLLTIETKDLDFTTKRSDLGEILDAIDARLNGLFPA
jgi:deoxyadenosine/deoxycytidine kinase